jgi:hypothetical protein
MTESGLSRPPSGADTSFWVGLLKAAMHRFLRRAAEVEHLARRWCV